MQRGKQIAGIQEGQCSLWSDAADSDHFTKEIPFRDGCKSEELMIVSADHLMNPSLLFISLGEANPVAMDELNLVADSPGGD